VKLTSTNSLIDLFTYNICVYAVLNIKELSVFKELRVFYKPGGYSKNETPDLISNSEVKLFSANGT
jgi:hypothetical protein